MKFPNAYNGVKKIYLAEVLLILAAILGIATIVVLAVNNVNIEAEELNLEGTPATLTLVFSIGAALIALIAFLLNLFGVISARKDDDNFKMAMFFTFIGIVCSIISAAFNNNEGLKGWMEVGNNLSSLFASYFVLGGIASLAGKYPDNMTMNLALKARTKVMSAFSTTVILRLIVNVFNIQNETILHVLSVIILLAQVVSYLLYMATLAKGKKMLAN